MSSDYYDDGYFSVLEKVAGQEAWKARMIVEKYKHTGRIPEGYKNYLPQDEEQKVLGILQGGTSGKKQRRQIAKVLIGLRGTRGSTTNPRWQRGE